MTAISLQQLNWADFAIIGLIVISALISLARGFVREAISLTTWIIAIWVGLRFAPPLTQLLTPYIQTPSMRVITAFLILFIVVLIIGGLINFLFSQLVERTGLNGTDRLLGLIFGIARGILLIGVLVLLGNMSDFAKDPWWTSAQLIPKFQDLAHWLRSFAPDHIKHLAQLVKY